MVVYLAQHGETALNRGGSVLGRSDAPLSTRGILMAVRFSKVLAGLGIRSVLTSPLGRARASAAIMARETGIVPVPVEELAELSCGRWDGVPRAEAPGSGVTLRSSWTDRPPDGESCGDAEERVHQLIEIIQREAEKGPVLVVGHTVVNRVLLKLWYRLDPEIAYALPQPLDLIYVLDREPPVHWLRADGDSGTGWVRS